MWEAGEGIEIKKTDGGEKESSDGETPTQGIDERPVDGELPIKGWSPSSTTEKEEGEYMLEPATFSEECGLIRYGNCNGVGEVTGRKPFTMHERT
ncbi:hypothetical protein NDU88_003145 [Pleurodeles waltl]|uniref:Uncharacterized protein n=1 Tax=Pleurodeles waltl TaxID=8319 RepID=A0AAV7RC28_PLEWA|nr:hypothetical protein NDU88_003145 [Pleurodeles waltl]